MLTHGSGPKLVLPNSRRSSRSMDNESVSELSDSLSEHDVPAASPGKGWSREAAGKSGGLLSAPLSIWDKGWSALLPQKSDAATGPRFKY